jgi:hypothetical protein
MRFETLIAVAVAAAAGCTPMQWVKEDATPQQLQDDSIQCQQDAWREARSRAWYYRPLGGPIITRDNRFIGWPYGSGDPFWDPYLEESRLTQFCMRSKGYALEPVEKSKEPVEKSKEQVEKSKEQVEKSEPKK